MSKSKQKKSGPAKGKRPAPELERVTGLVLTCEEVAALLTVSEDTVKNLHRVGQLKGVIIGKHLRWRLDDVHEFVDGLTAGV